MGAAEAIDALARAPGMAQAARMALHVVELPGLSNRTFRVDTACGRFAVQLPGAQAAGGETRQATIAATRLAHRLGVGAELVHAHEESGAIVTRWVEAATPATAEQLRAMPGAIAAVASRFAALHGSGMALVRRFDPLAAIDRLAAQMADAALAPGLAAALIRARQELDAASPVAVPIHGDPVPENVLVASGGVLLIDWDHAGMGDPAWDLAYFALEAGLSPAEEIALAAAHGVPGLESRRLALSRMTAAALCALWGADRMRRRASPDLTLWISNRREQATAMAAALYPGARLR